MDRVLNGFLRKQLEEGLALADASSLFELIPFAHEDPPQHYVARFSCLGFVQQRDGSITEANHFEIGIWFPSDYLIHVDSISILTWLKPREIFHPNVSESGPFICLGRIIPGTSLTELLYRIYELITWQSLTVQEFDALNWRACNWARHNPDRYPVDRRPLKWNPKTPESGTKRRSDLII